jgi:hypothetical protein
MNDVHALRRNRAKSTPRLAFQLNIVNRRCGFRVRAAPGGVQFADLFPPDLSSLTVTSGPVRVYMHVRPRTSTPRVAHSAEPVHQSSLWPLRVHATGSVSCFNFSVCQLARILEYTLCCVEMDSKASRVCVMGSCLWMYLSTASSLKQLSINRSRYRGFSTQANWKHLSHFTIYKQYLHR